MKAVHGVVPDLKGERLAAARERLRKRKLRLKILRVPGEAGVVVSQRPPAGVASAPGMLVTLAVGRGSDIAIR
jgi:beta-lactam-binding protein with PASTA domain